MMNNRRFGRREPYKKLMRCSCGETAKLTKRRNFSHGRKSGGRTMILYKCVSCNNEVILNKHQEVKRR